MPLSTVDMGFLRCPRCHAALVDAAEMMTCSEPVCAASYRKVRGIPVLMNEAESFVDIDACLTASPEPDSFLQRMKLIGLRVLPGLDLNVSARDNIATLADGLFADAEKPVILNIGGKHPASATALLCQRTDVVCFEIDTTPLKPRTSLVAMPHELPFASQSVDAVILDAVLEHLPDPAAVVAEVHRVLRPGGYVYSDTPFMLQVHGGAVDFCRFTHQGHRRLFNRFYEIRSGVTAGPAVALSYSLQYFFLSFVRADAARFAVKTFTRLAFFWLKYFDLFLAERPGALDAAHGIYFIGRKTEATCTDSDLMARYAGITPHLYPIRSR